MIAELARLGAARDEQDTLSALAEHLAELEREATATTPDERAAIWQRIRTAVGPADTTEPPPDRVDETGAAGEPDDGDEHERTPK